MNLNPKEAILNLLLQVVLSHKEQYIAKGKEALLKFLETLDLNENDKPDLEEAKEKIAKLAGDLKDAYEFVVTLIQKAAGNVPPSA